MALVTCHECGGKISDEAMHCVHCGALPNVCMDCRGGGGCRHCDGTGMDKCSACNGTGYTGDYGTSKCYSCGGTGRKLWKSLWSGETRGQCRQCNGTGKCPKCGGKPRRWPSSK